jgi:hypothetical protein
MILFETQYHDPESIRLTSFLELSLSIVFFFFSQDLFFLFANHMPQHVCKIDEKRVGHSAIENGQLEEIHDAREIYSVLPLRYAARIF